MRRQRYHTSSLLTTSLNSLLILWTAMFAMALSAELPLPRSKTRGLSPYVFCMYRDRLLRAFYSMKPSFHFHRLPLLFTSEAAHRCRRLPTSRRTAFVTPEHTLKGHLNEVETGTFIKGLWYTGLCSFLIMC